MTKSTNARPAGRPSGVQRKVDADAGSDESFRKRAQALGDPTRHAIYREIALLARPVAVSELVDRFGLNHNTVRQHLAKLRAADLIEDVRDNPTGPGRPRILYHLTPEAAAGWNDEGPYQRLSMLLLDLAAGNSTPLEVGRAAGRALGHEVVESEDPLRSMERAVADQGFAPRIERHGDRAELILEHCPFAAAASADSDLVCQLHRGMAEGLAEQIDGVVTEGLEVHAPQLGACRLHLTIGPRR